MKKILLIIVILVFANVETNAQFNAGFRLGANFCQIDGDKMSGYDLAGIVGGMFVSYPINSKWEGQFEMLFSQKGSEKPPDTTSSYASYNSSTSGGSWNKLLINYIEVPVMVNYKVSKKIKLSGGLGGAFMISNQYVSRNYLYENNVDFITKGEFSGTVGVQYYFTPKFSAFCRFTYSLLGINAQGGAGAFYIYDGGLANNVISFGAYYAFLGNYK